MTPILYVLVFLATVLAVEGLYYLVVEGRRDQATVKRRLRDMASSLATARPAEESVLRRDDHQTVFDRVVDAFGKDRLRLRLYRAGLTISPGRFLLLCVALGVGGWALASLLLADGRAVLFAVAGVLPFMQLSRLERKRMRAFEQQFPAALDLLTRALRAGNALTFAFQMVGEELGDPIGTEFAQVAQEIKLGHSVRAALENMAYRVDSPDVPFFVTAVSIQHSTGGNLAEILDNLGYLIRERFKLYGKVRALTAVGKASANILAVWPLIMVGGLYLVSPDYVRPLWETTQGPVLAMIAAGLVVVGYFFCRRFAIIKV